MNSKTKRLLIIMLACLTLTSCKGLGKKTGKEENNLSEKVVATEENKTYKNKDEDSNKDLTGPILGVKATYPVKIVGKYYGDGIVVSDGSIANLTGNPVQVLSANMKYIVPETEEELDFKPDPIKDWYAQFRLQNNQPIYVDNDYNSSQTLTVSANFPYYMMQGYGDSATNMILNPKGTAEVYSFGGTNRIFIDIKDPGKNIPIRKAIISTAESSKLAAEVIDDSLVISGNLKHTEIQVDYGDGDLTPFYLETDTDEVVIKVDSNGNLLGYRFNNEANNSGEGFKSSITGKLISRYNRNVPIQRESDYKYY